MFSYLVRSSYDLRLPPPPSLYTSPPSPTTRTAPGTPRDRTRAQQAQTHTYAGSARNTSHRVKHFTPTFTQAKTLHTTLRACSAHPRRSPAPLTRPAGRSRADANDAGVEQLALVREEVHRADLVGDRSSTTEPRRTVHDAVLPNRSARHANER